jgi:hypothetical protein
MDKYQVLLTLIIYFIITGITAVIFNVGNFDVPDQPGSIAGFDTWSVLTTFVIGGLLCSISGLPGIIQAIIALPFWCLLMYFIYLNIPKVAGSGSPPP